MLNMLGQLDRVFLAPPSSDPIPEPCTDAQSIHSKTQHVTCRIVDPTQGIEQHDDRSASDQTKNRDRKTLDEEDPSLPESKSTHPVLDLLPMDIRTTEIAACGIDSCYGRTH